MKKQTWERAVAVGGPVLTRPFLWLSALAALSLLMSAWREWAGLGAATGLNDGYSWGLYKNFNVTTLTALGSGGYAIGVLTYVFNRKRYHVLMRTALLTSILIYTAGMVALTVDVGRPWNLMWMSIPWAWNTHSVLFEVALCMTAYVLIALDYENLEPLLEKLQQHEFSPLVNQLATHAYRIVHMFYPIGVTLAFLLPSMHQSSLGSLMMVSGHRVHPIWQGPLLPLLYLVMAWVLGIAFVEFTLLASCVVWKRSIDREILASLSDFVSWMALAWLAIRFGDLAGRGVLASVTRPDFYSLLFWSETALIAGPALLLRSAGIRANLARSLSLLFLLMAGGMLYRYTPTTIAFEPGAQYRYFPSATEILMSLGFMALAMIGYLFTVKRFAILPATLENYREAQSKAAVPEGTLV